LVPADELALHVETAPVAAASVTHGLVQLPKRLAQIFARLVLVAIRPKPPGQGLARVRMIAMQQEIAEQFFCAVGLKTFEPAPVVLDPEVAEELDSQHHSTSAWLLNTHRKVVTDRGR